jgi:hypothetical protein
VSRGAATSTSPSITGAACILDRAQSSFSSRVDGCELPGFHMKKCRRSAAGHCSGWTSAPTLTRLLPNSLRVACAGTLPRPLPGSTVLAVRFRWRRAKGACHRLIFGTPSACSLCGRVVVIPVKPALVNRPSRVGLRRCRRSAAGVFSCLRHTVPVLSAGQRRPKRPPLHWIA